MVNPASESSEARIAALEAELAQVRGEVAAFKKRRRRRRIVLAIVAMLLISAAALHRPLLAGYALLFRVDDPADSDYLVLLLGGLEHRPAKVGELYRQGVAPQVLLCTASARDGCTDFTQIFRSRLIDAGVPPQAIRILPEAVESTRDEAHRVRDFFNSLPEPKPRRITLVTTAYHTARSRWIFRRVLGDGLDIRAAAASDHRFDEHNWHRVEEGLLGYVNETIKTVYYRLNY